MKSLHRHEYQQYGGNALHDFGHGFQFGLTDARNGAATPLAHDNNAATLDHLLSWPRPTKRKKKALKPAKGSTKAKEARLRKKIRDFW